MLASVLLIPILGGLVAQNPLPGSEDHLRAATGEKRVTLILDVSGSMAEGAQPTPACVQFIASHYDTLPAVPAGGIYDRCAPCTPGSAGCGLPFPYYLDKMCQVKAALNGCVTSYDGLFDQWASQIDFSIVTFGWDPASAGGAVQHTVAWTRNIATLESAVDNLRPDYSTPMAWGIMEGHRDHQAWVDGPGVYQCDQHFNVLMTDGLPNTPGSPAYTLFPCGAPVATNPGTDPNAAAWYGWKTPAPLAAFTPVAGPFTPVDAVCGTSGDQPIATYTLGFGTDVDSNLLTTVANNAGGRYYAANSAAQLAQVFSEILSNISDRTASFSPPSVQTDGLFVGNDSYSASFKPKAKGPWIGNLKKYCVVPPTDTQGRYVDEAIENRCLFKSVGGVLVTNPTPRDQFSGSRSLDAEQGGVGEIFFADYYNGRPPNYSAGGDVATFRGEFGPGNAFFTRRNVLTWNPSSAGTPGYKAARPNTMSDTEAFASGCQKTKLFAYLHGYDPNTVDCQRGEPTQLASWPFGSAVNTQPVILRWGSDCSVTGNCIVAFGADDGGVHFIDASNGHETAMLVPKHLFVPGVVANYPLANILDQPSRIVSRRPYVDGGMMRIHDDLNGNGIIDGAETAYLVIGLGKGGRGMYFMDVRNRFNAPSYQPTTARNPIYPVVATLGNWAENLRDTVAKPWVGRVRFGAAAAPELMAMFPSGHEWYLDRPQETMNNSLGLLSLPAPLESTAARTLDCETGGAFADYNRYNPSGADFCAGLYTPGTPGGYDAIISGLTGPRDMIFGPLWYRQSSGPGSTPAASIGNFTFRVFDLRGGDYLVFEDLDGNPLSDQLTGTLATVATAPYVAPVWVSGPFRIRVHSDGVLTAGLGVWLDSMQWVPDNFTGGCFTGDPCAPCDMNGDGKCDNSAGECNPTSPSTVQQQCILCDLNRDGKCTTSRGECGGPDYSTCNGHWPFVVGIGLTTINGATRTAWADTVANGSTRLMFTKVCPSGVSGQCYDQTRTTSTDLQYMTCPIVAEVRAYEEGGVARNFYVGDQCGQLWKFWTTDSGATWNAKRTLSLMRLTGGTGAVAAGPSKYFRRFDRAVDLTVATCKGGRAIGVYWGSGNTARPGTMDDLAATDAQLAAYHQIANRQNIIGAWFDDGTFDTGVTRFFGAALKDLTPVNNTDVPITFTTADAQYGWFLRLQAATPAPPATAVVGTEQMLREPTVFSGVAYYKTNQATSASTTCVPGRTRDRIYAVGACSGAPAYPGSSTGGVAANGGAGQAGDRSVWTGDTAIGGNIFVYTPKDTAPIVSAGDLSSQQTAQLVPQQNTARTLQMYLWWRGV